MKTAKQIYLRMEEKGKELLAQIKSLDKIIVTEETLKKIFNVLHEILNVKEERVNVRLTL